MSLSDITWNLVDPAIWTSIEPSIAVVSACLPILRSLWIWGKRRAHGRSADTPSRPATQASIGRSYSTPKSYTPKNGKKSSHDSLTKPINELSGESDNQWVTYSSTVPSRSQSNKKSEHGGEDIDLQDLSAHKEERLVEKSPAINKSLPKAISTPTTAKSEKKRSVAELYGS